MNVASDIRFVAVSFNMLSALVIYLKTYTLLRLFTLSAVPTDRKLLSLMTQSLLCPKCIP